jgi:glycine oxidase
VVGCSIALRLQEARVRTLVLERSHPGAEASSAAAGILGAQEESRGPGPLFELMLASRSKFRALAEELRERAGIDIGYRETGLLSACFQEDDEAALERRHGWQRALGHRLHWCRGDELREREPSLSPAVRSALSFPDDGQVEPRAYVRALAIAAGRAGATIASGAHVRRIVHDGVRVTGVDLDGEIIATSRVVVAAGSWSTLIEGTGLPSVAMRPVRGQMAVVEANPPAIHGTIVSPRGGYLVGRASGRVLVGSTMELVGYDPHVTAGGLFHVLALALEIAPVLSTCPVVETWANFRPATVDELPVLGSTPVAGLYLATGHFRNGILLSPVTAEILCDLIVRGTSRWDLAPFAATRLC